MAVTTRSFTAIPVSFSIWMKLFVIASTLLYRERIPSCAVVLDLMSSWVSHLPEDQRYEQVIGHGLNAQELQANPRLDRHWVQTSTPIRPCRWRMTALITP